MRHCSALHRDGNSLRLKAASFHVVNEICIGELPDYLYAIGGEAQNFELLSEFDTHENGSP